ncbi:MAG: NUDIX hydrolase [Microgenomates group bacterium Gr01-1014_16]|nr:MAG: NUDIX hydrolase [Microgenomates group bacterium Gr01-1014_16]
MTGQENIVYQGKIIEVVQQTRKTGDTEKLFEFARRSPGTRLIIRSDDKILLTKEYRTETDNWDFRLPGGKVFDTLEEYNRFLSSGQDILPQAIEAAKKEAREEVGIEVEEINHVWTSINGATVVWDLFYFEVSKFKQLPSQNLEAGEEIETSWVTLAKAKEIALSGQMQEDRSVAVLLRYLHSKGVHNLIRIVTQKS